MPHLCYLTIYCAAKHQSFKNHFLYLVSLFTSLLDWLPSSAHSATQVQVTVHVSSPSRRVIAPNVAKLGAT